MKSTDKKQIQLHKMELDEKYLSRKLLEISQNTPLIAGNMKKYKAKYKGKNKGKAFVHEKALIKILRINKRIMRLLIDNDFIKPIGIFSLNLYTIADVEYFVKITMKFSDNKTYFSNSHL
ncbi:MAG: hypothetical protein JXR27_10845 [Paludibacteraceae bacterium]|nr:hypothetical protein [Paludibacteraceae bacterium]